MVLIIEPDHIAQARGLATQTLRRWNPSSDEAWLIVVAGIVLGSRLGVDLPVLPGMGHAAIHERKTMPKVVSMSHVCQRLPGSTDSGPGQKLGIGSRVWVLEPIQLLLGQALHG